MRARTVFFFLLSVVAFSIAVLGLCLRWKRAELRESYVNWTGEIVQEWFSPNGIKAATIELGMREDGVVVWREILCREQIFTNGHFGNRGYPAKRVEKP